jgi:hypothetical protein
MTEERTTILLQIAEHPGGGFAGSVMEDGIEETLVKATAPHITGIFHWLTIELGLRATERLWPERSWVPGNQPTVGLYEVRPVNETEP